MQIRNFLSDSVATNPNVGRVFPPWLARFSLQQLPRWYLGVSPHGISCLVDSKQTNNRTGHNVPSTVDDPIPIAGIFQKEMPEVTEAGKRDVGFVVSNNYCRYISLPWSDVMLAKQTRLAYLRSAFAEIYGNAAYDWEMTVQAAPYGQSRIACAMDSAVLQTLRQECAASGARILFCRPYFDKALDFFRGYGLAKAGILAVVEQDVLTIGQWDNRMITEIDVEPYEKDWENTLEAWCARQALLSDALPEVLVVCPPQFQTSEVGEHPGWQLLEWPDHVRDLVSNQPSLALPAVAL